MTQSHFQAVHPVLPSQQVPRAIEFYIERLGFELVFQDSPQAPRYGGLRRGSVELHVQWHDPAEWHAVERPMLRFRIQGLEDLFGEYSQRNVFHDHTELRQTAWGTREFAFYDLDGNGLTFFDAS
ncbi:MAG: VOC family protein [Planctomycetota bacterium]|nr:VOC family protein [Planctomycetota bacterium]